MRKNPISKLKNAQPEGRHNRSPRRESWVGVIMNAEPAFSRRHSFVPKRKRVSGWQFAEKLVATNRSGRSAA